MSQMRDLPPIAGAIIWARQIERQLLTYMKRVEDVLGKGWELYAEGQKLQSESAAFRKKLETRPVYDAWLHDINRRDMGVNGRLFEIVRLRGGGFQLAVNFDPQIITLFKEVRNLLWLNFHVPHAITNMAKDAKRVYPHAVSLMETVRTYGQTLDLVENNMGIEWLVAEYRNEAQQMVSKGAYSDSDVDAWTLTLFFLSWLSRYEHQVGLLCQPVRQRAECYQCRWPRKPTYAIRARVRERRVCAARQDEQRHRPVWQYSSSRRGSRYMHVYQRGVFRTFGQDTSCREFCYLFVIIIFFLLSQEGAEYMCVQIDRLNLEGYANLEHWVADLDKRIEGILLQRLVYITQVWCSEFDRADDGDARRDPLPLRDIGKRRAGKGGKEDKV